jgi:hypothetical protein
VDRDDARFVADALDSRISGDRETLDQLAASSFVRLGLSAARVRALAAGWDPALLAAAALEAIAKYGAQSADEPAPPNLKIFVDKMRELAAEQPPRPLNRFERRRRSRVDLPRSSRVAGRTPARLH